MKQSVDEKLLRQKLEMWQKKVADLEKEYEVTMVARGEAAREGDLRENAAYQMLTEKGEFISAQIGNTKKIILTHNHPNSTGISTDDIKLMFQLQLGGIRAIGKDGSIYFVKNIGGKGWDFFISELTPIILQRIKSKYSDLVAKSRIRTSNNKPKYPKEDLELAQVIVDEYMEELLNLKLVEYIKYQ